MPKNCLTELKHDEHLKFDDERVYDLMSTPLAYQKNQFSSPFGLNSKTIGSLGQICMSDLMRRCYH